MTGAAGESRIAPEAVGGKPGIAVAQLGARRHYAVPVALQQADLLEAFYTDLYVGSSRLARGLRRAASWLPGTAARRLFGRADETLPAGKVRSFPWFGLECKWRARMARRNGSLTQVWLWAGQNFGRRVARAGFGQSAGVFAYSSAALEIFQAARGQGLRCVLDHATAPRRLEMDLVRQQVDRYPQWSALPESDPWTDEYTERQGREAELADVILCGSSFVRTLVEQAWGLGHKCVIVPLGLRTLPTDAPPKPHHGGPLRVLFVGDEAIRKGVGDLAAALDLVPAGTCQVRVIGHIDLSDTGRRVVAQRMELVGAVPRTEMTHQYQWADVLVLPSVSDTFALVVLEALAHGVPVVTTPNTGAADVIRERLDGFVVPAMCPQSIADRLTRMADDRGALRAMSAAARSRAQEFGMDRYSQRLVEAVTAAIG